MKHRNTPTMTSPQLQHLTHTDRLIWRAFVMPYGAHTTYGLSHGEDVERTFDVMNHGYRFSDFAMVAIEAYQGENSLRPKARY